MDPADRRRPHGPARFLLHVEKRIALLEALVSSVRAARERRPAGDDAQLAELEERLERCYRAREALRRGRFRRAQSVEDVLRRVALDREHRRWREQAPLAAEELAALDLDELARRLQE